eukprot:scaffold31603_cov37-Tisochrysis_lutea.AAC.2
MTVLELAYCTGFSTGHTTQACLSSTPASVVHGIPHWQSQSKTLGACATHTASQSLLPVFTPVSVVHGIPHWQTHAGVVFLGNQMHSVRPPPVLGGEVLQHAKAKEYRYGTSWGARCTASGHLQNLVW